MGGLMNLDEFKLQAELEGCEPSFSADTVLALIERIEEYKKDMWLIRTLAMNDRDLDRIARIADKALEGDS